MAPSAARAPGRRANARTSPIELPPPRPTIVPATDLGGVGVLKHGNLYLLADAFGDIHPDSRGLGLYELDTRVLSCSVLRVNGVRPTLLSRQTGGNHVGAIRLVNPDRRRDPGMKAADVTSLSRRALSISRRRWIAGGLVEDIEVTNYSATIQEVTVELELDADAADIFEVRGYPRRSRGTFRPTLATDRSVVFAYEGLDGLVRRTLIDCTPGRVSASPRGTEGEGSVGIRWDLEIGSGESAAVRWSVTTDLEPVDAASGASARRRVTSRRRLPRPELGDPVATEADYAAWTERCARISSDGELLDLAVQRSVADLRLLHNDGPRPGERYLAAGVPWFTTLFGRDSVITALQVVPFMPEIARQTLRTLADWQATADDPERDMEPGKFPHELRSGEMARTGELAHRPYYGSIDVTPLWLILLDETIRWTGDLELARSLWPHALAALAWIDTSADRDGDGLVEYERRAAGGLANQAWKDSGDSMRHRDGSIASPPIAPIEVQGYVFDARRRMARLARRLGDETLAATLERAAEELRGRFDGAFWMPDVGYYAMALDGEKRQVGTVGSNAGHALWTGIVPDERQSGVIDWLVGPRLYSGWGIRTYAEGQPGFNPVGYHTGTVWPHDNAIAAAGMMRVGRGDAALRVASGVFEAARHSPDYRLPELFCGFTRGPTDLPVPYPVACSPQAWAAGAPLLLIRSLLGLEADATERRLELVRPLLPAWLGKVTVHGLRVGDVAVDLLFHRWRGTTSAEVLRRSGPLDVRIDL